MAGKADIVEAIADVVDGITKKQAAEAFDATFDAITDVLVEGERVSVPGFGTFSVTHREERTGRNPRTGEPITIGASNSARFKAGKDLKEALNE